MRQRCLTVAVMALVLFGDPSFAANPPRLDAHGDPLPAGALLRIGTVRLRPGGIVNSMAFTPDSKRLVTASDATGIQVWDVATGKELSALGSPAGHRSAVVAPNGRRVAFDEAKKIRIHDPVTRRLIQSWDQAEGWEWPHGFSPDGSLLATVDDNGGVRVRDVGTGEIRQHWPNEFASGGNLNFNGKLIFSPGNQTVAFSSGASPTNAGAGALTVRDIASGKQLDVLVAANRWRAVAFSPEGKSLVVWEHPDKLRRWRTDTWAELKPAGEYPGPVDCMSFAADGQNLVIASAEMLEVVNPATGKIVRAMTTNQHAVSAVACSPDGKRVAAAGEGGPLIILDFVTGKPLHPAPAKPPGPVTVRFLTDGNTLVSRPSAYLDSGTFSFAGWPYDLWDTETGRHRRQIEWDHGAGILSGNGQMMAFAKDDGSFLVRERGGKKKTLRIEAPGFSTDLRFSANGDLLLRRILEGDDDGLCRVLGVWDAKTGGKLWHFKADPKGDCFGRFTPDGSHLGILAGPSAAGQLTVVDAWTGKKRPGLPLPLSSDFDFLLSPSGRRAVVFGGTMPPAIYDCSSRQLVGRFHTDGERTACVALSPDGNLIAVGSREGRLHVWDAITGQKRATIDAHRGGVLSVDFAPDGRRLITSGGDTTMLVWDAAPWQPLVKPLTQADAVALWEGLGSGDAARAWSAVAALARGGQEALALLKEKLRPVQDPATTRKWIADLDSAKFAERDKAMANLLALGERAVPALDEVLAAKPTLEVRRRVEILLDKLEIMLLSPALIQALRGLEALELAAAPDAAAVLEELAEGDPDGLLTQDAAAALRRLACRKN
jgi:WD40 repeat protein